MDSPKVLGLLSGAKRSAMLKDFGAGVWKSLSRWELVTGVAGELVAMVTGDPADMGVTGGVNGLLPTSGDLQLVAMVTV